MLDVLLFLSFFFLKYYLSRVQIWKKEGGPRKEKTHKCLVLVAFARIQSRDPNRQSTHIRTRQQGEGITSNNNGISRVVNGDIFEALVRLWVAGLEALAAEWGVPAGDYGRGSDVYAGLEMLGRERADGEGWVFVFCDQTVGTVGAGEGGERQVSSQGVVIVPFERRGGREGEGSENGNEGCSGEMHFCDWFLEAIEYVDLVILNDCKEYNDYLRAKDVKIGWSEIVRWGENERSTFI